MYINLLTKIKNAQALHKDTVRFPYSKMDEAVLQALVKHGYVAAYEKKGRNPKKFFDIQLAYKNGEARIQGMKFVSKPSRNIYAPTRGLRLVRQGYGMAVVSTSQGIMADKEAKVKKIGGQVLFNIW
jgi:small subunit ribosomal protein S8